LIRGVPNFLSASRVNSLLIVGIPLHGTDILSLIHFKGCTALLSHLLK